MLGLQVLLWLLLVGEVCIAMPILYLCVLSIFAILNLKKREIENTQSVSKSETPRFNFAILIPAHNEEIMLHSLLESLYALEYPKNLYSVYVVADNCTDNTAKLALSTGWVHVYERFDEVKRGKGFALNWLLQQLKENQLIYDAYVIFDADSSVSSNFLHMMDRELARGAHALQGRYTVLNAVESHSTILRWVALTLVNHLRPLGRNGLGASATLTGNGMCFSHALLMRYPWQAFALAEDYQYYLTLVEYGERVRYVPEAVVYSQMPVTFDQMRTQDIRWESAEHAQAPWQTALSLLRAGFRFRDFIRLEAVVELLTPPLSFLVCACVVLLVMSLLAGSQLELLIGFLLIGGLICYVGTALYLLSPPPKVYVALLYTPGFVVWKLWVYLVLSRSKKHTSQWVRTSRTLS